MKKPKRKNRKSGAAVRSSERVMRRRKVSVVQYSGYHAMYPGQAMLEKRNGDKSKNTVTWADIIPDQTYKTGNWKITVEYEAA